MLTDSQIQRAVKHWRETADDNFVTMQSLYRSRRYSACLFFGHLVLEKALKILVTIKINDHPPRIHNLIRLAELATIDLSEEELDLLSDANEFNLEARYPEVKHQFYKKCDKKFVDLYYTAIKKLYRKLCRKNKLKK